MRESAGLRFALLLNQADQRFLVVAQYSALSQVCGESRMREKLLAAGDHILALYDFGSDALCFRPAYDLKENKSRNVFEILAAH